MQVVPIKALCSWKFVIFLSLIGLSLCEGSHTESHTKQTIAKELKSKSTKISLFPEIVSKMSPKKSEAKSTKLKSRIAHPEQLHFNAADNGTHFSSTFQEIGKVEKKDAKDSSSHGRTFVTMMTFLPIMIAEVAALGGMGMMAPAVVIAPMILLLLPLAVFLFILLI